MPREDIFSANEVKLKWFISATTIVILWQCYYGRATMLVLLCWCCCSSTTMEVLQPWCYYGSAEVVQVDRARTAVPLL
jgi:hypothetical protein